MFIASAQFVRAVVVAAALLVQNPGGGLAREGVCSAGGRAPEVYGQAVAGDGPAGDADGTGSVDLLDAGRLQAGLGGSGAPSPGSFSSRSAAWYHLRHVRVHPLGRGMEP